MQSHNRYMKIKIRSKFNDPLNGLRSCLDQLSRLFLRPQCYCDPAPQREKKAILFAKRQYFTEKRATIDQWQESNRAERQMAPQNAVQTHLFLKEKCAFCEKSNHVTYGHLILWEIYARVAKLNEVSKEWIIQAKRKYSTDYFCSL